MKVRRTLEKRMRQLEASGRGRFYGVVGQEQVLCSVELEADTLDVFVYGFSFVDEGGVRKVLFDDVLAIKSHLNVSFFSDGRESFDFFLPIDIECESFNFSLSVPFLSYSNILNILTGLRDDWCK
ncbi:hypothetical protein [Pseudomonas protegens]|uniref:hypothetical protein n=1 Tax=Pseudomonas protegens TaxID=380021 RepID=UPI0027563471|nr:hypothetical protein [Pseudomonas protegens]MDP9517772.1 hypothetical protein [Pseudomonas protegens]